jgi:hypothetical protein
MELLIWISVILTIVAWILTYLMIRYTNDLPTNGAVVFVTLLSVVPVVNLIVMAGEGFCLGIVLWEKYVAEWWNRPIKP